MSAPDRKLNPRAKGPCQITGVLQKQGNIAGVYARILVRDSEGNHFYFDASSFVFDLALDETGFSRPE